jgi:hypothetical protein
MVKGSKGASRALWSVLLCALVFSNLSFAAPADRTAATGGSAQARQAAPHSKTAAKPAVDSDPVAAAEDGGAEKQSLSDGPASSGTQVFTLQANAQTYIVAQGQSAAVTVTVITNGSGFSGYVSYACSDTAPESICVAPTLPVSSSSPASFIITTTFPTTGSLHRGFGRGQILYAALLPGLLGIWWMADARRRSRHAVQIAGMLALLVFSTLSLSSCGNSSNSSSNNPGTAKGSYPITITATAASGSDAGATSQLTVTLTVQ